MSTALTSRVDRHSPAFLDNATAFEGLLEALATQQGLARGGGGEKAIDRHHSRGRLLAHERIDL
ncbi:MAG: hypothetical protein QOI86_1943, partial [Actinomycetota bacterium]|nr:hypothetical protein [Actinomycetota bacterium]